MQLSDLWILEIDNVLLFEIGLFKFKCEASFSAFVEISR